MHAVTAPPVGKGQGSTDYRPDIDGLRAIAVLAVILFHANLGVTGGYVGVDIFFVISGFLITRLILGDLESQRFSLSQFWERRARRILPALVCVVIATIIAAAFRLLPEDYENLGRSVVAQSLLVSNYWFYTVSGYFNPAAAKQPLLHTWSLAVEEQFYLIFPLLFMAAFFFGKRTVKTAIITLGVASLSLSVLWSYSHAWANFYFLPTRAWELLCGAFMAILPGSQTDEAPSLANLYGIAGLGAVLAAIIGYGPDTHVPGIAALLPCIGAMAIIRSGRSRLTLTRRLLSLKPLVFVGLISYSLYLWHWPLFALARYWDSDQPSYATISILMGVSFGLATLSWRFVERPFRERQVFRQRKQMFTFAVVSTLTLLATGLTLVNSSGLPSRFSDDVLRFASGRNDVKFFTSQPEGLSLKDAQSGSFAKLGAKDQDATPDLLIWGDSHAMSVLPALDALCNQQHLVAVAAVHAATPPFLDFPFTDPDGLKEDCKPFSEAVIQHVATTKVPRVLLVANWPGYLRLAKPEAVQSGLKSTIDALKGLGCRIWIMPSVPAYPNDIPQLLAHSALNGLSTDDLGMSLEKYRQQTIDQTQLFQSSCGDFALEILDPIPFFGGAENRCLLQTNGYSLYSDNHHLSIHGAEHLRQLFMPLVGS
jgi:peptidoglycan/LPS O-acetylase OafA/YrhL